MNTKLSLLLVVAMTAWLAVACGEATDPTDDQGINTDVLQDVVDNDTNDPDVTSDTIVDAAADSVEDTGNDTGPEDISTDPGTQYPDAAFINEHRNLTGGMPDEPFTQKFTEYFHTTDRLPSLDVRATATAGDYVFVGTAEGMMAKSPEATAFTKVWPESVARIDVEAEIVDIADAVTSNTKAAFITSNLLVLVDLNQLTAEEFSLTEHDFAAVAVNPFNDSIYLGGPDGLYQFDYDATINDGSTVLNAVSGFDTIDVADVTTGVITAHVYVASADGLVINDPESGNMTYTTENSDLPDNNVMSVRMCPGALAVGTETGFMAATSPTEATTIVAELDGLAWGEVISIACDEGSYLLGHEMGATLLSTDFSSKEYFYGLRWMVDNIVYDEELEMNRLVAKRLPGVAIDGNGDLWLGGQYGLTRIYTEERTLADKEVYFDSLVEYFWRMGGFFCSDGDTSAPYEPVQDMLVRDKDNDGLWTQMMIGGWCMAYNATGDEKYYNYAHKAMQNMYKLIDYPWVTFDELGLEKGFISRSIISHETDRIRCSSDYVNDGGDGNRCPGPGEPCTVPCVDGLMNQYDYKVCCGEMVHKVNDEGITQATHLRWNPIEVDGKKYVWKADTSSDEIAGHFFGFPVYYDLCAKDEEEKTLVASYAAQLAGYIADNAMNLIDYNGTHTTFGIFGPDTIGIAVDGLEDCMLNGYSLEDCAGRFYGGGWLNSNEGISMLLSTYHMTGDKYFYDVYENLITEHKYDQLMIPSEDTLTIVNPSVQNHSDHELAMLAYTTVLRYEPNEERRQAFLEGFEFLYDWERPERNPWWAAVATLSGMDDPDVQSAVETLRLYPDDLREVLMNNCFRKDYELNPSKDRGGDLQLTEVPPFPEIRAMWWNGNPYECAKGGRGTSWNAPTAWLLPYYMALYTGIVTEPPGR